MPAFDLIGHVALVGIGATVVMDAWLALLSRLGVPSAGFAMVGRWVGHLRRGRFAHDAIAKAPAIGNELGLGWLTHYAVGIAYAAIALASHAAEPAAKPLTTISVITFGGGYAVKRYTDKREVKRPAKRTRTTAA